MISTRVFWFTVNLFSKLLSFFSGSVCWSLLSLSFQVWLVLLVCLLTSQPISKKDLKKKKTPVNRSLDLGSLMKYSGAAGSGSGCHRCLPGVTVTMT